MKKLLLVLIIGAVISPLFAQDNKSKYNESEMYYKNVTVEKIYPSPKGYIIQYRRGENRIGTVGIPNEWFTDAGGKAEMLKMPPGTNWPSMTIFYKDGNFHHIRLYVHHVKGHSTYGNLPQTADVSKYFSDSDNFTIEY